VFKQSPESIDAQRRATYRILRSQSSNAFGGSIAQFTVSVKALTDATFAVFGSVANKNIINTYVRATGMQSGAVLEFKVSISKLL
jgi:ribosomal protein L9